MRLFVAVCFSEEIREAISEVQELARHQGIRGRYVPAENLHLTLAFLGECGSVAPVREALNSVDFAPFQLVLSGTGSFGQVFWLGVRENPCLTGLSENVRAALSQHGIFFDPRPFKAHITLIRDASGTNGKALSIPPREMTVRKFSLEKSEAGRGGVKYTELFAFRADMGKRSDLQAGGLFLSAL